MVCSGLMRFLVPVGVDMDHNDEGPIKGMVKLVFDHVGKVVSDRDRHVRVDRY